eukprot:7387661-Prymnesium_polylepis.1
MCRLVCLNLRTPTNEPPCTEPECSSLSGGCPLPSTTFDAARCVLAALSSEKSVSGPVSLALSALSR